MDGRLVANASFVRGRNDVWAVANVVTDPRYRRLGLATRLMTAIIATARAGGGREVHLQVRCDNGDAHRLYERLGFRPAGSTTWLTVSAARRPAIERVPDGLVLLPWGRGDRAAVRRLCARADPLGYGIAKVFHDSLDGGWAAGLAGWLAETETHRVAAWCDGVLWAAGAARRGHGSDPHHLSMVVDPGRRGLVESVLAAALLGALADGDPIEVQAELDCAEEAAMAALEGAGFRRARSLDRLVLRLR